MRYPEAMWRRVSGDRSEGGGGGRTFLRAGRTLLALALFLPACPARAYSEMTAEEARERIQAGGDVVVLDVREYSEFCGRWRHLENAACLPWSSGVLRDDYGKIPADWDVIVHCAVGNRSPGACIYLESNGFTSVFNMTDGIVPWPYETEACEPEPLLFLRRAGDEVWIDWRPPEGTQYYDLLRGRVDEIAAAATTVDLGAAECLARETPFTYLEDDTLPGSGSIFFYLVRQAGGDFGSSSGGLPRVSQPPGCD